MRLRPHTREECEKKLQALIVQMNAEWRTLQYRMRGLISPEKLTKKQRQIWEYMRLYPEETKYSAITKGANVTRHTVAKHHGMIHRIMDLGISNHGTSHVRLM